LDIETLPSRSSCSDIEQPGGKTEQDSCHFERIPGRLETPCGGIAGPVLAIPEKEGTAQEHLGGWDKRALRSKAEDKTGAQNQASGVASQALRAALMYPGAIRAKEY
jgi:hypothetical protein